MSAVENQLEKSSGMEQMRDSNSLMKLPKPFQLI